MKITKIKEYPKRFRELLSQLTLNRAIGISGIAILCAASIMAIPFVPGQSIIAAISAWLGGIGSGVLASKLKDLYENIASQPDLDEIEKLTKLARALTGEIQNEPTLRNDIDELLDKNQEIYHMVEKLVTRDSAAHGWFLVKIYQDLIQHRNDFIRSRNLLDKISQLISEIQPDIFKGKIYVTPPLPELVLGRENDLREFKKHLGILESKIDKDSQRQLIVIRGWPGVGKSIFVNTLAYDPEILGSYPDGILWTSLGKTPNLKRVLNRWSRALEVTIDENAELIEMADQLRNKLRTEQKKILIIIDDVWELPHAEILKIGVPGCSTIITTRLTDVAEAVVASPDQIYILTQLEDDHAFELLKVLSPTAINQHPQEARELAIDLEGLPLALQVAGRLLNVEINRGWDVKNLLHELREGVILLKAKAPADRTDLEEQTRPSVAVLLQKSTDLLNDDSLYYFTCLGVFAPKPATFDLNAIKSVCQTSKPKQYIDELINRGLLEYVSGRYQMHALLVVHAKSFFED